MNTDQVLNSVEIIPQLDIFEHVDAEDVRCFDLVDAATGFRYASIRNYSPKECKAFAELCLRAFDALRVSALTDSSNKHCAELEAQVATPTKTLEVARKDAERLDFIETNARRDPKMDGNHVYWPTTFNNALRGPSLREAIDTAIAQGAT